MSEKIRSFIYGLSKRTAYVIFGTICFYLFLASIYSTCIMWYDTEITYYIKDFPLLMVSGLLVMMLLLFLLRRFLRKIMDRSKYIIILFTLVWAGLLIGFACNTDISRIHDQAMIYEAVKGITSGDYTLWQVGGYVYCYPFQSGLILLYAPIMLIFGENTYGAVQALSILLYWMMAVGFYKLSKKYFDRTVAVFTYIGVLFFLPLWGYVKYFYGNLSGLSFIVWAIYFLVCFMEDNRWKYLIGSSLCLAFSMIFKSNFLIYGIAMLLVLVLESVCKKKACYLKAVVVLGLTIVLASKLPLWVAGWITGCPTDQGLPFIHWIAMGLRESYIAPGWYSGDSMKSFADNQYSVDKFTNILWQSIENSLAYFGQNKYYALSFFGRKTASVWNNPTFESFAVVVKGNIYGTIEYWMKDILYNGGVWNSIIMLIMDVLQSIYLFGNVLYLMYCKKENDLNRAIPLIAFIGGFLLHIFWEGRTQYTFLYFIMLIPYALMGYKFCLHRIIEWYNGQFRRERFIKSKKVRMFAVLLAVLFIIGIWDNPVFDVTIKIKGDEEAYVWLFKEQAYWKDPHFTKEGFWEK